MTSYYPVFLQLRDQLCIVIGGGKIAEGKVDGLIAAGASVRIISPHLTRHLRNLVDQKQVECVSREYLSGDLEGGFLVISATDQASINHKVWEEAVSNRQLVNVVDDTPHCNFIMPAVLRKGDLSIAISTAGKAPALAVHLKERLQNELGPEYESFLELAGKLREPLAKHKPDFEARKLLWYQLVDSEILDILSRGDIAAAVDLISQMVGFEFRPNVAALPQDSVPSPQDPG